MASVMELYGIVNPGIEQLASAEVEELCKAKVDVSPSVISFKIKDQEFCHYLSHAQAPRRILAALGRAENIETFSFTDVDWKNLFPEGRSFKIEVENVKGQDNRFRIAKQVGGKLFPLLEKNHINGKLELKRPDFLVVVFYNGEEYFVGIQHTVEEHNSRGYRIFPHSGSFKGDFAYFFVRKAGFNKDGKLLVGFLKDGVMAIEAALFASGKQVTDVSSLSYLPFYQGPKDGARKDEVKESFVIAAFDHSIQNVTASRKNAKLAAVHEEIDVQKLSLEDLDVRFGEDSFDSAIFHVTSKDEDSINEIYYQASYVLKSGGRLLLIAREQAGFSISDKFELKEEGLLQKGDSIHKYWLLEKR
ncbi:hypothetical protein COV20_05190 [Candidatus Woesearchaeota archaeon CG10_big_fil_rev_8_21_14_0_10_45_16]|nr:MAG: hypothetical protein COV20_05190 [Candidatus Woesearchaeota archaeon CG10_big_fil_rev_8_21_14_0_10_45_16]